MAPYKKPELRAKFPLETPRRISRKRRSTLGSNSSASTQRTVEAVFIVGKSKRMFCVSSWIIFAISDVFKAMLLSPRWTGSWRSNSPNRPITISDANPDAFELLIKYCKDQSPIRTVELKIALDAYYIGHKYNILGFMKALELAIRGLISVANVLQVLVQARLYNCSFLRSACWSFIERHSVNVLRSATFLTLPKEELFEFWGNSRVVIREFELAESGLRWCQSQSQLPQNSGARLYEQMGIHLERSFIHMTPAEKKCLVGSKVLTQKWPGLTQRVKAGAHNNCPVVGRRNTCECRRSKTFCLLCTWGESVSGAPKPVDGQFSLGLRDPSFCKRISSLKSCKPEDFLGCECARYNSCPAFPNGNTDILRKRVTRELEEKNLSCVHKLPI